MDLNFSDLRRIADLVRSFVYARKSASIAEIIDWSSHFFNLVSGEELEKKMQSVISLLCHAGDMGFGNVREERVLVALTERRVQLPDGRTVALGDHGIPVSNFNGEPNLFPDATLPPTHSLLEYLQETQEGPPPSVEQPVLAESRWAGTAEIPEELSRVLALCGSFDPAVNAWSIGDVNAAFINDWLGISGEADQTIRNVGGPDPEQEKVIDAPASARLIVEAAPGSGKTFTACARIAALTEREGVAPSRILVLSFTRVAVAELRERVTALISGSGSTAAVCIRTFDAFAASLLGVAGQQMRGGFDAGIRAATRLLRQKDLLVDDFVSGFEHVIIDEAQDLVGNRKTFCDALIDVLDRRCGITVLGDRAQAIYGYQARGHDHRSLLDDLQGNPCFSWMHLTQDHRTRTSELREMFVRCRQNLLSASSDSRSRYFEVRQDIQAAAVESNLARIAGNISTTRGLILTRSRRALLTVAESLRSEGRTFRMRMSDRPLHIEGWIGATLGGIPGKERISRDGFAALYEEVAHHCTRDIDECWEILRELEGATGRHIVVSNIAEALEDPPLEIIRDYDGDAGPLLSTIHAVKGRESDRVLLLFTRAPAGDGVNWDEEARVLYVGATRASAELRTGWVAPDRYYSTGSPERYWAPCADHRLLEIGLDGDMLAWADLLQGEFIKQPRRTITSIWEAAGSVSSVSAFRTATGNYILRRKSENAVPLGCLSPAFVEILRVITQTASEDPGPEMIDAITVSGATTVSSARVTGNAPPIGLMPLLSGFCRIDR